MVLGLVTLLRLKRDLLPNNFSRWPPEPLLGGFVVVKDCKDWLSSGILFSDDLYYIGT